jgi:ferritin-like metal-binding protein YciE
LSVHRLQGVIIVKNLKELFEETLKDIYYAEKAILKALPKMAKKASSEDLSAAFNEHLEQTRGQVKCLEQIFEMLGKGRAREEVRRDRRAHC